MGRHVQILVLAAAAQPALALCASNRCRVIIQVFLLSFIFVPASVVASSVYICACRQARGQCKVVSAAAALLNVFFIAAWTVYVAVAVTKIKGWSGMWWIFVVDAPCARETSRSFIVWNRWTRVWEGGGTRACDFYASRVARGRVDARARTTGRERTSERMETDCWLVF